MLGSLCHGIKHSTRLLCRQHRLFSSAEERKPGDAATRVIQQGLQSLLVDFEISKEEAIRRFEVYQQQKANWLHAHNLLTGSNAEVKPVFLPYWVFDLVISADVRASLGTKPASGGPVTWKDMESPKQLASHRTVSGDLPAMQVYASYQLNRQLGEGGKAPLGAPLLSRARPLGPGEAEAMGRAGKAAETKQWDADDSEQSDRQSGRQQQQEGGPKETKAAGGSAGSKGSKGRWGVAGARLQSPMLGLGVEAQHVEMKQAIAWQLAHRALVHDLRREAEEMLAGEEGVAEVKDVLVTLQVHQRQARVLYLPAYLAHYEFGTRLKQGTATCIVEHMHLALMGGTREGGVTASVHRSPAKAEWGTAGVVGGLGLGGGELAEPLFGVGPLLGSSLVESAMAAVMAAFITGMYIRQQHARERHRFVEEQVAAEKAFFKEYEKRETQGAAAEAAAAAAAAAGGGGSASAAAAAAAAATAAGRGPVDDLMLWLWIEDEWRRWEDEPWSWVGADRRRQADEIFRRQHNRRLQRVKYEERKKSEQLRQEAEAANEERRERVYGHGRRHHRHQPEDHGVGHHGARRRRDFLGYYKALGIDVEGEVSTDTIKSSFKAQALKLHPDKVVGQDQESQRAAHVQFQKLQIAYDTLKDPEKRRLYDRGQLMH